MTVPSDDDVLAIIPHVLEADLLGEEDDFDSSVDDVQRARRIRAPREEADVFELKRRARDWDPYDDENLVRAVVKMRGLDAERLAVEFHVKAQFLRDRWRTQFEHAYVAAELEAKEGLRGRVRKFIDELGEIERARWREELKRRWDSGEKLKFEAHVVERTLLRAPAFVRNNCAAALRRVVDGGLTEPRGTDCKAVLRCAAVVDPFTSECCDRPAHARGFCFSRHGGRRLCTYRLSGGLLCSTPANYGDLCAAHGGYPSCVRCGLQIISDTTCTECGGKGKVMGAPSATRRTLGRRVVVDDGEKTTYKFLCEATVDNGDFCPKVARHASAFCIGHGGGERCEKVLDDGTTCGKGAVGGGVRNHCKTHGGGPRCPHEDPVSGVCGRLALYGGPTLSCGRHGGGRQCSSTDVHLDEPERAHYHVEGKWFCYFCLCVKYPDDSRADLNVCKETLILAELERLAPDLYQNVRLGVVANVPRLTVRPQVLEYTCDTTLGACSRRRPDIFLDFGFHLIIGEIDEEQHRSYTPRCEYSRLLDILEDGGDRPLHAVRFNPDKYTDSEDNVHESMFRRVERRGHPGYEARQPEFDRRVGVYVAALRAARDAPSHTELYRVTRLFYDGHVEGETPGYELAPDML